MAVNSTASQKEYKQLRNEKMKKKYKQNSNIFAKIVVIVFVIIIAIVFVFASGAFNISEVIV